MATSTNRFRPDYAVPPRMVLRNASRSRVSPMLNLLGDVVGLQS